MNKKPVLGDIVAGSLEEIYAQGERACIPKKGLSGTLISDPNLEYEIRVAERPMTPSGSFEDDELPFEVKFKRRSFEYRREGTTEDNLDGSQTSTHLHNLLTYLFEKQDYTPLVDLVRNLEPLLGKGEFRDSSSRSGGVTTRLQFTYSSPTFRVDFETDPNLFENPDSRANIDITLRFRELNLDFIQLVSYVGNYLQSMDKSTFP